MRRSTIDEYHNDKEVLLSSASGLRLINSLIVLQSVDRNF